MTINIKLPDVFVPDEREYCGYCTIKLFKRGYITKEEAIKMLGYSRVNETTEKVFKMLCNTFEKKYVKMCGCGYSDIPFLKERRAKGEEKEI